MIDSNEQEEEFIYLVSCIDDLNRAWRLLKRIIEDANNQFAYIAFQFALIEYSKPYTTSYGKIRKRHVLDEKHVPSQHLDLHQRILKARSSFLADSDLTIRDAKLYVSEHPWGKDTGILQNTINAEQEYSRIDEILDLIEKTWLSLYEHERCLRKELHVNSS